MTKKTKKTKTTNTGGGRRTIDGNAGTAGRSRLVEGYKDRVIDAE
jgi:hypothetical protein